MSKDLSYQEPTWSAPPVEKFQLEVLKDGSIVSTIDLDGKAFFTLGRQPDIVDIVMDHPSISRMHAVLNFRDDGALMLRDLGSAQGTQLNKSLCDKNTYYRVYVGDMIKFGASTRKYIVCGPENQTKEEYDSANMEIYREKLARRSAEIKAKLEKEEERSAFSWGMREDAEAEAEEDAAEAEKELPDYLKKLKGDENYDRKYGEKFSASIDDTEAKNSKDAEILEKIRKKERKIQNMQEENRRIYMKESSQEAGLTEGQMAAVSRNDKSIASLETEVEDLVKTIRAKAGDRAGGSVAAAKRALKQEEDESDVLDLTAQTADSSTNWRLRKKLQRTANLSAGSTTGASSELSEHRALGFGEIKNHLAERREAQDRLAAQIAETESFITEQQTILDGAGRDNIEAVVAKDRLAESKVALRRLQNERDALGMQTERLQTLLKAATPALSSLVSRPTLPQAVKSLITVERKEEELDGTSGSVPASVQPQDKKVMLPARPENSATGTGKDSSTRSGVSGDEEEGGSEDRLAQLMRSIEEEKRLEAEAEAQALRAKEKAARDLAGSEAARLETHEKSDVGAKVDASSNKRHLQADEKASGPAPKKQYTAAAAPPLPAVLAKAGSKADAEALRFDSKRLEGGETAWVPPPKQTGDGRTSLNDKFGY
jgi:pSer/pThr/pTyr-binding forkhead associated (FHA) protein